MYDYHMHTRVSFDGHDSGLAMALGVEGLAELAEGAECFTDAPLAPVVTGTDRIFCISSSVSVTTGFLRICSKLETMLRIR